MGKKAITYELSTTQVCTIHDVVVPKGTLFCGDCDKYITCKDLLEENAPACKIYRAK